MASFARESLLFYEKPFYMEAVMLHPYQLIKLAKIHEAEVWKATQQERNFGDLTVSQGSRSTLRKVIWVAILVFGSLSLYWIHLF